MSVTRDRGPGARSHAEVDNGYLELLESGAAESRTHVEQMAMRMSTLLRRAFPKATFDARSLDDLPFIARLRAIGRIVSELDNDGPSRDACFISDTVRGWLAMAAVSDDRLSTTEAIASLDPFICDHHFAVREWAWLALRPRVVADPRPWIVALAPLLTDPNPFRRRFAIEVSRPRSVWGQHVKLLKAEPQQMGSSLSLLRCEPHRYVQDSLGNWLNDAARSRPEWVSNLTSQWLIECECRDTKRIVQRGTRSL